MMNAFLIRDENSDKTIGITGGAVITPCNDTQKTDIAREWYCYSNGIKITFFSPYVKEDILIDPPKNTEELMQRLINMMTNGYDGKPSGKESFYNSASTIYCADFKVDPI